MNKSHLLENLNPGDLRDAVDELIEIDRHKPKLGDNSETVVICFKCSTQKVAMDLGAFIEWSSDRVNDVEVSEASDKEGRFHVYVEIARMPGLAQKILDIVQDCEHVTEKQDWKFVAMDGQRRDLTLPHLNFAVIQDPKIYNLPPESRAYYQRMKTLTQY